MWKIIVVMLSSLAMLISLSPEHALAAGISASDGGTKTIGQTFNINVVASGAEFNAFQGSIATSGPVSVVSVSPGEANWMSQPSANGSFSGALLGQKVSSFTIATIKLKGTSAGQGAVTVSNVVMKNGSATVGTSGGSGSFTIEKAPELPGSVKVESSTHPDQAASYETTTISLSWNKESGVDGFSYLLDQSEGTTSPTKITDANTAATFQDKAIGAYYFHIRAHKPDGWGKTTHFKINIKEPDAKINALLSAPANIRIEKSAAFENDVTNGTVTGIVISGESLPGYTVSISMTPAPTVPEGKTLSALTDENGKFSVLIDFPIASGFHTITLQGLKVKELTPVSPVVAFEISQAKGGSINILTADDTDSPKVVKAAETPATLRDRLISNKEKLIYGALILIPLLLVIVAVFAIYRKAHLKNLKKSINAR